jgi:Flp pilus assembly protein TadG
VTDRQRGIATQRRGARGRGRLAARSKPMLAIEGISVRLPRGQAMVELALILPIAVVVLLVGIQLALIGQATVAVSQLAYTGARYASVNPNYTQAQVKSYIQSVGSPTLMENGGADLSVSMTPCTLTTGTYLGSSVQLTLTYNLTNKLFLPNPFLLSISFPSSITETQTAFCE